MSFAGTVSAMITSLKNNARPKRKPFERMKERQDVATYGIKLKRKEMTQEQTVMAKREIIRQAERENRMLYLKFTGVILLIISFVFILLYMGLIDNFLYAE